MEDEKAGTSTMQGPYTIDQPKTDIDGPSILPSDNPLAETPFNLESIKECYRKNGLWTKDEGKRNTTLLHAAAGYGLLSAVEYLMMECSIGANIIDENKIAPLHNAVAHKHYEVVKCLIKNGADVDILGIDGYTPLHLAATYGDLKMYKLLKERDGNLYIRNFHGETPYRILEKFYESVQKTGNNMQETVQHSEDGDRHVISVSGFKDNKKPATNGEQEAENKAQVEYEGQKNGEIKHEAASYDQKNGKKSKQTRRKERVTNKTNQSGKNKQPAGGTAENIVNTINRSDHEYVGLDKKDDDAVKKALKRGNTAYVSRKGKFRKRNKDFALSGIRKEQEKTKTYQVCERYGDTEARSMPDAEFWSKRYAKVSEAETCRPNSSNEQKNIMLRSDLKKFPKFKKVSATVSSADDALESGMPVDEKNEITSTTVRSADDALESGIMPVCEKNEITSATISRADDALESGMPVDEKNEIKSDCIATELVPNFKALLGEMEDNTQGEEKNTKELNKNTQAEIFEYLRRKPPRKIVKKGSSKKM